MTPTLGLVCLNPIIKLTTLVFILIVGVGESRVVCAASAVSKTSWSSSTYIFSFDVTCCPQRVEKSGDTGSAAFVAIRYFVCPYPPINSHSDEFYGTLVLGYIISLAGQCCAYMQCGTIKCFKNQSTSLSCKEKPRVQASFFQLNKMNTTNSYKKMLKNKKFL